MQNEINIYSYIPFQVLTVFKDFENKSYYMEQHAVLEDGTIGAGIPMQEDALKDIGKVLYDSKTKLPTVSFHGMIPANLLFQSVNSDGSIDLIWKCPSQLRTMFFHPSLNIPTGKTCFQQNLIFKASIFNNAIDLTVMGYAGELKEDTQLCLPVYHNVSKNGDVCLGNVDKGSVLNIKNGMIFIDDVIGKLEHLFFSSNFTHGNDTLTSLFDFNLNLFWTEMIHSQQAFPMDKYLPTRKKLKNFLKFNSND